MNETDQVRAQNVGELPPIEVPKTMELSTVWLADKSGDWQLVLATERMSLAAEVYAALTHTRLHRGVAISTYPIPLQRYQTTGETL